MRSRRPTIGGLGIVGLILALSVTPVASAAPSPATGLVTAEGSGLAVDGHPWKFVGYNMPCAQPFLLDAGQLPYVFASIANNSGATALRVWFFQQNGGPGNWAPFDRVVAAAKADGMKLIPTLVNEWPTCEANPPVTIQKTLPWYQGGYQHTGDGYKLSFHDFAVQVATHFAGDATIAFWQLVNEATAPTPQPDGQFTCDEQGAAHALRSFGDDMTAAIHAVDPHHLVSLGTLGGTQCGTAGSDYQYIHAGAVDICEYHDYHYTFTPFDTDTAPDALATRLRQCQTIPGGGRPFFVGESGVVPNVQPPPAPEPENCGPWPSCSPIPVTIDSLNLRAQTFRSKVTAAFAAGISGYLIWFKGPHFGASNDSYAIGDGDPTEAMMAALALGPITTSTVPPNVVAAPTPSSHHSSWTNSPVLLVGGGIVLVAAWTAILVTRRRRQPVNGQASPPASPG